MEKIYLAEKLKECIQKLYLNNSYLFEIKASERTIVSTLGCYLKKFFEPRYNLDCEYNRYFEDPKKCLGENCLADLIIHKRGNNSYNLLYSEFKTFRNTEKEEDIERVKYFMENEKYNYKYGLFIIFGKEFTECDISFFYKDINTIKEIKNFDEINRKQ